MDIEGEVEKIKQSKNQVVKTQNFEEAARMRDLEKKLLSDLEIAKREWELKAQHTIHDVNEESIADVVAMMTGIPVNKIAQSESVKLVAMENALNYVLTDDWRWDKKTKLVKRPYTIDTWDFDYTAGRHSWLNFQVTDDTYWGIMHGDCSGYYEAFTQMASLSSHLGFRKRGGEWKQFAEAFRRRSNKLCFNGRLYTHHVQLVPVTIEFLF